MSGAAELFLVALGVAGTLYTIYFAIHFYRHRERRRIERRARDRRRGEPSLDTEERRAGKDRRHRPRRTEER